MEDFQYSDDCFLWPVDYKTDADLGKFDVKLRRGWETARDKEYFRYKLDTLETKILPGKYKFVAQLNLKRAQERRKPQDIQSVSQPFNHEIFNFTKIKKEEILFEMLPDWFRSKIKNGPVNSKSDVNLMIINVSPLEYCNSLVVPSLNSNLPQQITKQGLRLAIECVLLSRTRTLKVGFNSLCGYASVNHQHFHLYYLQQDLYIESMVSASMRFPEPRLNPLANSRSL